MDYSRSETNLGMAQAMSRLNQYWRVLATGFCFSVFGLGGLTLSFIVIPTIRIFVSDQTEREYKVKVPFDIHSTPFVN